MSVFEKRELKKQTFLQKIFKIQPKINFMIELENLLAENEKNIVNIDLDRISFLSITYKTKMKSSYDKERKILFSKYLSAVLQDEKITEEENKSLHFLKAILCLSESYVKEIVESETKKIYKKNVENVLLDNNLSEDEKEKLSQLKKDLFLSDEIADELYSVEAKRIYEAFVNEKIEDRRLSPEEEKQIKELEKNLNIVPTMDEKSKKTLEKYKLYWMIENAPLPTIDSDIALQKSEELYFASMIDYYEMKTSTRTVNYGGVSCSTRIMSGVYLRGGSINKEKVTEDNWKLVDAGKMYITNKRILIVGNRKNRVILLKKLLGLEPYADGIEIQKETGPKTFFKFNDRVDICGLLINRLIQERD